MSHPKIITEGAEARAGLIKGIVKLSNAVKSTLGPSGRTVLIESQDFVGGHKISKDGVSVAKEVNFSNPIENLAAGIVKEAATKTATSSGDGTSTAILLTEAIMVYATKAMEGAKINQTELIRAIKRKSVGIIKELKAIANPVDSAILMAIASISANNDEEVGKIISDAYSMVGENGVVNVKNSKTSNTYSEVTSGIKLDRGYTSSVFINNQKRDECILDKPYVLMTDTELRSMNDIVDILNAINKEGRSLLIIGECSAPFLNTLTANVMKGSLKVCNIVPPSFGYKQHDMMTDLAMRLGATFFSDKTGDLMNSIKLKDLGQCESITIGNDYTTMEVSPMTDDVKERIEELKQAAKEEKVEKEVKFIHERIALLSGSIGVIYVGGGSDIEQKELFDRVEDSVLACRSALEEGALPGGGVALMQACNNYISRVNTPEERMADSILRNVVQEPFIQILKNSEIEISQYLGRKKRFRSVAATLPNGNEGVNAKTGEYGDMFEMGIIDPLKVTRTAFENAISVACTLLSTSSIITIERA